MDVNVSAAPEQGLTLSREATSSIRWETAYLCLGARLTTQANRLMLGAVMPVLATDIALSTTDKGKILSAFGAGYALTQVLGGMISDRFGAKWPLFVALLAVSVGSMLMVPAAEAGVTILCNTNQRKRVCSCAWL